jgi:hypothetical protein
MCGAKKAEGAAHTCGAAAKAAAPEGGMQSSAKAEGGCACCRDMAMMHGAPAGHGMDDMAPIPEAPKAR